MTSKRRWIPPIVIGAVIAAGALVSSAQAQVELPDRTPAQVLALAGRADVDTLSGTVQTHSALGLPALPPGPRGGDDALALLTGDHRLRVWLDGPERQRIQVMDQLAETNITHHGEDVWTYQSRRNEVTHLKLTQPAPDRTHHELSMTPEQVAAKFLAAAEKSTDVTVGKDVRVAGRPAYDLRLTPRTTGSLVEQVSLAVDAETGLPLRVRVEAVGQDEAAFEIGYTSLSLERPAADVFAFAAPPGAEVDEVTVPSPAGLEHEKWGVGGHPGEASFPGFQVLGEGWTSVLEMPARASSEQLPAELAAALQPVDGGSVLRTALVSVLVTDDGRLLVGAVSPKVLQEAARR